jgi:hypothetical protein
MLIDRVEIIPCRDSEGKISKSSQFTSGIAPSRPYQDRSANRRGCVVGVYAVTCRFGGGPAVSL